MSKIIFFLSLILVFVVNVNGQITENGLVGYWPFNGNANDESGNNNHGTVYGPTLTTDRYGNENCAYSFDGIDDRIFIGNDLLIQGDISISLWVKSSSTSGQIISTGNRNSYRIGKTDGGVDCGLYLSDASDGHGAGAASTLSDEWNHIVLTYDRNNVKLFINNELKDVQPAEGDVFSNQAVYLNFGVYQYFGSNFHDWYNGLLDDVRLYDRAITDSEISELFHENDWANEPPVGLVGYWPFNGNANDESGNGNNGIVNGATLSEDRFGNPNKAYLFTASNKNHITLNSTFGNFGTSNFTVSAWVKKNLSSGTIFSKRTGGNRNYKWWEFGFDSFDVNESYTNHSNIIFDTNTTLQSNIWYHLVGVRDGTTIKYYVNGNLYETNTTPLIQNIINTDNAEIGCWVYAGTPWGCFDGLIDDIRIYDRAITESEISELFHENGWSNDISNDLVAYYPFNGNANDESGNSNHGTVNGASLIPDRFGNLNCAYSFDGIDDFVEINTEVVNFETNDFTISYWLYINNFPESKNQDIMGKREAGSWGNYFNFSITTSGFVGLEINEATSEDRNVCTTNSSIITQQWNKITLVRKGLNIEIYLNGQLSKSIVGNTIHNLNNTVDLVFGARYYNSNLVHFFNGGLDDIKFYSKALTKDEILYAYQKGIPTNIEKEQRAKSLKVYPNPTIGILNIDCGSDFKPELDYKVNVFNSIGNLVYETNISEQITQLNLIGRIPSGVCFVQIISKNSNFQETQKVVIR